MSAAWVTILGLAVLTAVLKASGPLLLGHRELPGWTMPVIAVLPGALMTALMVVQVFSSDDRLVIDERLAGLATAGLILIWRREALVPAMLAAALVAALLRALS